eukprot:EG_transcript_18907
MGRRSRSRSHSPDSHHRRRHGKGRSRSRSRSHRRRSVSRSRSRGLHRSTGTRRRSRSRSRSSKRHRRKESRRSRSRSPSADRPGRPAPASVSQKGPSAGVSLAMQKVKERMREQLAATAQADTVLKHWEGLSPAAAGFAAEEQALQDFRPSVLMAQARILEAVRSEEVEEVAAARPTRANPKRAAADDKHWNAMFASVQEQANQNEDAHSDAGSIDSDALFDPQLLKEDEHREARWRAFVQQIHEEKLLQSNLATAADG